MTTLIRRVYEALKTDSRKGDVVYLVNEHICDLEIDLSENEIKTFFKYDWKKLINEKVKQKALTSLTQENSTKTKTKHINHESLEMRKYLSNNINTYLTKTIFSVRAGTIDLKCLNAWKYEDDKCVMKSIPFRNPGGPKRYRGGAGRE